MCAVLNYVFYCICGSGIENLYLKCLIHAVEIAFKFCHDSPVEAFIIFRFHLYYQVFYNYRYWLMMNVTYMKHCKCSGHYLLYSLSIAQTETLSKCKEAYMLITCFTIILLRFHEMLNKLWIYGFSMDAYFLMVLKATWAKIYLCFKSLCWCFVHIRKKYFMNLKGCEFFVKQNLYLMW